jgi:hypothetical protein
MGDELQRRIQLEALLFSTLATSLLTAFYGFLQKAGLPHFDVWWVTPMLMMFWAIGTAVATWRYR